MAYKFKLKRGEKYAEGCFDPFKHLAFYQQNTPTNTKGGVKSQNIGKADY